MNSFKIDHIDPLGQGVFKQNDQIYFIPKTLPGETGQFEVLKSKKGVNFAKLTELTSSSPLRINPECPHFSECPGCQYLHTSYTEELKFKQNAFYKIFQKFEISEESLKIVHSDSRTGYRNRIQLHYNKKANIIGFKDGKKNRIIPVPNCIIMNPRIKKSYDNLLQNWQFFAKDEPVSGHVEIYDHKDKINISWNQPYASSGFSQVNQEVNKLMLAEIQQTCHKNYQGVLDLFAGNGNITSPLKYTHRACVDIYPHTENPNEFFNIDLYDKNSLQEFKYSSKNTYDLLVLDPPRSGHKNINEWIEEFKPKEILYISCNPATMARDLSELKVASFEQKFWIIDLFPSTHHFEVMTHIKINQY